MLQSCTKYVAIDIVFTLSRFNKTDLNRGYKIYCFFSLLQEILRFYIMEDKLYLLAEIESNVYKRYIQVR